MARSGFDQDYEVGRKATRKLAMARPFVGAAFAVAIFLLLKSGLVDLGQDDTVYFYAAIGFLAGFSERWARVIVGGALGGTAAPPSPPAPDTDGEAELDDTEPEPGTQLERTTTRETVRTTP
jgi:hypothetical protein